MVPRRKQAQIRAITCSIKLKGSFSILEASEVICGILLLQIQFFATRRNKSLVTLRNHLRKICMHWSAVVDKRYSAVSLQEDKFVTGLYLVYIKDPTETSRFIYANTPGAPAMLRAISFRLFRGRAWIKCVTAHEKAFISLLSWWEGAEGTAGIWRAAHQNYHCLDRK